MEMRYVKTIKETMGARIEFVRCYICDEPNFLNELISENKIIELMKKNISKKINHNSLQKYFEAVITNKIIQSCGFHHYFKEYNYEKDNYYYEREVVKVAFKYKNEWKYISVVALGAEQTFFIDIDERFKKTLFRNLISLQNKNIIERVHKKGYVTQSRHGRYRGVKSKLYYKLIE